MKLKIFTDTENNVGGTVQHDMETPTPLKGATEVELISKLEVLREYNMGLLPPAVRWISPDKSIVIFERPPMVQLVEFLPYPRDSIKDYYDYRAADAYCSYELNIPWTVYVVSMDATYLPLIVKAFIRTEPVTSLNDEVYLLPLLNFYANSKLCNPATRIFEGLPQNLGDGINIAYNLVWNSGWNFDLMDALLQGWRSGLPFGKRLPTIRNYTNGERRARDNEPNAATVINFLQAWASKSMDQLLAAKWSVPSTAPKNGNVLARITLNDVILLSKQEMAADNISLARRFSVNMASTLM